MVYAYGMETKRCRGAKNVITSAGTPTIAVGIKKTNVKEKKLEIDCLKAHAKLNSSLL